MDELIIELARKMTEELEKFLRACKKAGDVSSYKNFLHVLSIILYHISSNINRLMLEF